MDNAGNSKLDIPPKNDLSDNFSIEKLNLKKDQIYELNEKGQIIDSEGTVIKDKQGNEINIDQSFIERLINDNLIKILR